MPDLFHSAWTGFDLEWWQALAAVAAVLVGATIFGLTGFGFALAVGPFLLLLFPPPTVVVLTASLAIGSSVPILIRDRGMIQFRIVSPLVIPALVGLMIGVAILTKLDARIIKLAAGFVVIVFALIVARGFVIPGIRSRLAPVVAGFASGVLATSTGMSGPPVVLFLTDRTPEPRVFRACIAAYFFTINGLGIFLVTRTGAIGAREFGMIGALLPIALIGRRAGQHLHDRVDRLQFRRITLALLVVTGISAMLIALAGFL